MELGFDLPPIGQETIHESVKACVVTPLQEVRQLMDDDEYETAR